MSIREMSVAGSFYPNSSQEIEAMLDHFNTILEKNVNMHQLLSFESRAVIVPHAGYIYSGFTANVAYRTLATKPLKQVVVIGPSHRQLFKGISIADYTHYATPFGMLPVATQTVETLKQKEGISFLPHVHAEHSTEVQMPFIKYYMPDVSVVELIYGKEDPHHLSSMIDQLLEEPQTAVVISTDLSHFYDIKKAQKHDGICLDAITTLDPLRLEQGCEACGKTGVEAIILSARERGLIPHVLDYRTSADISGDTTQVVGYLSALFEERNHA